MKLIHFLSLIFWENCNFKLFIHEKHQKHHTKPQQKHLHKVEEDANPKMCNCRVKKILVRLTVYVKLNVRYIKQPWHAMMIQLMVRSFTLVWQNQNLKNVSPTIKLHFVTNVTKKRWNFQMRFGDWKEITLLPGRQSDNLHNSIELLLNATSVWIKILRLQPSQKITDSWVTWTGSRWKNYTILKLSLIHIWRCRRRG